MALGGGVAVRMAAHVVTAAVQMAYGDSGIDLAGHTRTGSSRAGLIIQCAGDGTNPIVTKELGAGSCTTGRGGRAALNPPDETDETAGDADAGSPRRRRPRSAWEAVAMRIVVV